VKGVVSVRQKRLFYKYLLKSNPFRDIIVFMKTIKIKSLIILSIIIFSASCFAACGGRDRYPNGLHIPIIDGISGITYSGENDDFFRRIFNTQEEYLLSLQTDDGAFIGPSSTDASPYFACFACIALLENPANAPAVRRYLEWHTGKLNERDYNGLAYTIYDYKLDAIGLATELKGEVPRYDSTDSYAALFLAAVYKYYAVTGDKAFLLENKEKLIGVADVIMATYHRGLTYAKPDYKIKYAMDNAEAYAGLAAVTRILYELEEHGAAKGYYRSAKKLQRTYERKLYKNDYLLWYLGGEHDPNKFYPDNACQVYPAIFGVLPGEHRKTQSAYETLNKNFPDWPEYKEERFPWAILSYGAVVHGDSDSAVKYLEYVYGKFIAEEIYGYRWYNMEGAMAMLTASALLN